MPSNYKISRYFFILCFFLTLSKQEDYNLYSKVVIFINSGGNQQILSNISYILRSFAYGPFNDIPDEIYINGNIQNTRGKKYII